MYYRVQRVRLCRTIFSLSFLLFIANCATIHRGSDLPLVENEQQAVFDLIAQKEDAIRCGDMDRFQSLLNHQMPEYVIEQQHWLQYYRNADVSDFQLKPVDIARRDAGTYIVSVRQQYLIGEDKTKRECRFNQKYIRTSLGWKDSDLEFREKNTAHFHLMAVETVSDSKIETIAKNAETAFRLVQQAYGDIPQDSTIIKIYDDPYLVRELTKVSAERKMYGWYEYPESIKITARKSNHYSYTRTLAHELMHKTSLAKARNQSPWFAEGLAVYFGTFQALGGTYIDRGWLTSREHVHPISWLEEKNPETLTERIEISRFYGTSGMVIKYIETCYGKGKSRDIVAALSRFPQTDEGFEFQKHNALYTRQLHEAIKATLKVDSGTFNDNWLEWINKQNQP
jgi:hypothetical protein